MADTLTEARPPSGDYSLALWLLKLGSLANLYFIVRLCLPSAAKSDAWITVPALILLAVSAYRCLFPVRYEGNIVFHDSPLSSVFATRLLATFSEVAYIFLFSYVLRRTNQEQMAWVTVLSWAMVGQVVVSQVFVWTAIVYERLEYYFYEEFGWALIFAINTIASAGLYLSVETLTDGDRFLLQLNLLFGVLYLPWQILHLRFLHANAQRDPQPLRHKSIVPGLRRSILIKDRRTDAASWGGWIGLSWMTAYWATLIPLWVYTIARTLNGH